MANTRTKVPGKTQMQVIWEWLQTHPNLTSAETALCLGESLGNVSSELTQMYRRNMVARNKRTWINAKARKQTNYEYSVMGTGKYVLKDIAFVPAHPRKSYAAHAQERRDAAEARAEKWIPVVMPLPWEPKGLVPASSLVSTARPTPAPVPVASLISADIDIENMTVKQARALREQLNAFFGGVK